MSISGFIHSSVWDLFSISILSLFTVDLPMVKNSALVNACLSFLVSLNRYPITKINSGMVTNTQHVLSQKETVAIISILVQTGFTG
jgi:ABC-type spermidine/putrescine transport system permease subunit II